MTSDHPIEKEHWERIAVNGTFEEAMAALEQIVDLLENGNLPLQVAVECFETGGKLSRHCQQLLNDAELRVQQVQITADLPPGIDQENWDARTPTDGEGGR